MKVEVVLIIAVVVLLPAGARTQDVAHTPEEVRSALERVYETPELSRYWKNKARRDAVRSWLEKRTETKSAPSLESNTASGAILAIGSVIRLFLIGAAILIVAVGLGLMLRSLSAKSFGDSLDPSTVEVPQLVLPDDPSVELTPEASIAAAEECRLQGDYKRSVNLVHRAALASVERAGLIRSRSGLTNRDYFRALATRLPARDSFRANMLVFERTHFGRRPATDEECAECMERYRSGFPAHEPAKATS